VGEAPITADNLCRSVTGLVERDEDARDDFAQAPVLSIWEDGGVESGLDRALVVIVGGIGIDGDIKETVGRGLVVFDGALSALGINAEVDLAALS
jgi:hypothetical protein